MKYESYRRTIFRAAAWLGCLGIGLFCQISEVWGWQGESGISATASKGTASTPVSKGSTIPEPAPASATPGVKVPGVDSEPERIARLQRAVQSDASRLEELKRQLDDPGSDYAKAEMAFNELDVQLGDRKKLLHQAVTEGDPTGVQQRQAELAEVETKWGLAKKDFQLALEKRKAQLASIATLETKIEKDNQALDRLRGIEPLPVSTQAVPAAPKPVALPAATPTVDATPPVPAPFPISPLPVATKPTSEAVPGTDPAKQNGVAPRSVISGSPTAGAAPKPDQVVVEAQKVAAKSEAAARRAEENAASLTERLEILRQDIELERKLRAVANSQVTAARNQRAELNSQLEKKVFAGEEVGDLRRQVKQAEDALAESQAESERITEHLDQLQTELANLQGEQVAALQEAERKRQAAENAQRAVTALNSPFSMRNILNWLASHGVTIAVVLLVLAAVLWMGRLLEDRFVSLFALRGARGRREERENRAKTLVSVLHNAVRTLALGAAAIMVLDECSVPVGPILGGAAVFGLAVAFGAQSLIKDYFTGFMVLMEQQYMIGDVIKIGDATAQVERITLRMTVLRDLQGRVHFIPHGQITTVTNLTHEWSRAVFEIGVAYREDVDRVMDVLLDLGRGLRHDSNFAHMMLEDPVMLGVNEFGESAVMIKFTVKTRPLHQWDVKRELLRRIKKRFDELGIEIPFPHRTMYFANSPAVDVDSKGLKAAN